MNPTYLPLIYDLLAKDDRTINVYTGSLAGALWLYPMSKQTVLVYMDIAQHTTDPRLRGDYLRTTAALLGLDLGIHTRTPPVEEQRILADFEAWFEKNKKYIEFDENGHSSLAGSKVRARPRSLTGEERARIRKDPACVLELFQGSTAGMNVSDERIESLMNQCGSALFGSEGVRLMREMMAQAPAAQAPSFDQQMGLAAARSKYPMLDAGLLAVAYVAADDADPKHRELAKTTLDDIGMPEEITRVLKGESKEVRKKALELANEMIEKGS